MKMKLVVGGLVGVALASSAGCSSLVDERSAYRSPTSAVSPIPDVQNPRDISVMARRACDLLTARQAVEFGVTQPPEQSDFIFGTTRCSWAGLDRNGSVFRRVGVGIFTNNPTLEMVYRKRASRAFFELSTVDGYPVAVSRSNIGLPICDIDVKTAERQSFTLTFESDELKGRPQEACEVAKRVASAVLTNLPPKS